MILFFDTETTGLVDFKASPTSKEQPRLVQLGLQWTADNGELCGMCSLPIIPVGFEIPPNMVHGITTDFATKHGVFVHHVLGMFRDLVNAADLIVAHNFKFDSIIIQSEFAREDGANPFVGKKTFCTMLELTSICKVPNKWNTGYKWPKLEEAYEFFFNEKMVDAHDAFADVTATRKCYFALQNRRTIKTVETV